MAQDFARLVCPEEGLLVDSSWLKGLDWFHQFVSLTSVEVEGLPLPLRPGTCQRYSESTYLHENKHKRLVREEKGESK